MAYDDDIGNEVGGCEKPPEASDKLYVQVDAWLAEVEVFERGCLRSTICAKNSAYKGTLGDVA